MPGNGNPGPDTAGASQALAQRLIHTGYDGLFKDAGHADSLGEIWTSATQHDFETMVDDPDAPALARFLGCHMLLSKDMTFLSRVNLESLSEVYIQALLGNYTGRMSDWGFLESNDDVGVMGSMFLVFGERSIPQLIKLLSDATVVEYVRPFPDVSGFDQTRLQRVRIKDFAALYVSKIRNLPLHWEIRFDARDREISKLQDQLSGE